MPWIAYPYIERYSIGWRMGVGESYIMEWSDWYEGLDAKEQKEYQCLFPEPITWKGYWEDEEIRKEILGCSAPEQIKALGRKVRNFDETVWDKVKYSIVLNGNYLKFSQNPELREFLLATGDTILVEASPYDTIWGIGMSAKSENAENPMKWRGHNLLGFALMEVRDEICYMDVLVFMVCV